MLNTVRGGMGAVGLHGRVTDDVFCRSVRLLNVVEVGRRFLPFYSRCPVFFVPREAESRKLEVSTDNLWGGFECVVGLQNVKPSVNPNAQHFSAWLALVLANRIANTQIHTNTSQENMKLYTNVIPAGR